MIDLSDSLRRNSFKIGITLFLLIQQYMLQAQIKPDATKIIVPGASGTTVTPNKPVDYAAGVLVNTIRTWQPQQPISDETFLTSASRTVDEVNVASQYLDGLGRPLQTVSWQTSPGKQDIVAPVVYDEFGREQYKYLPYTSPTTSTTGKQAQFKMDPFSEQSTFYTSTYKAEQPAYANETFFYAKTNFEASPLNRVTKSFAPGNSGVGGEGGTAEKSISMQYLVNTAVSDDVRIWTIGFNNIIADNTNVPYSNTADFYSAGQLYKQVTIDEAGNAIVEYKDKEGKVILKKVQIGAIATDFSGYTGFLSTYYIYDDLGQLRTVLQPKAVTRALANGWVLDQTTINELCFRYEYDQRQRMIAKKVPGAGWVYMVYDIRDRLVFVQDASMRAKSPEQWSYTLYDDINRPVQSGIMTYSDTWSALVAYVSGLTNINDPNVLSSGTLINSNPADLNFTDREYGRSKYEATNSITFEEGFTSEDNATFVAEIITATPNAFSTNTSVNINPVPSGGVLYPLTYSYYDNYNFGTTKTYNTANNSVLNDGGGNITATLESLPAAATTMVAGMSTGTRVRVLEDPNNLSLGSWLETVIFYDDKGRAIQVQADNYKGGKDIVTTRYNFTNKPVATYLVHSNPSGGKDGTNGIGVKTSILYDHAGRVTKTTKKVIYQGGSYERITAQNTYDALGQLKSKRIGQKSATDITELENDQYSYNIRGWLKGVNYYNGATYGSQVNVATDKWFAFDLSYDWGFDNNASQFNGNISGMRWKTAGDGEERAFGFKYDAANRLLKADFARNTGSWTRDNIINFDVQMGDGATAASAYDENGNIKAMTQYGMKGPSTSGLLDLLTYTYKQTNEASNQLLAVTEDISINTTNNKLGDFTDKNRTPDDYDYDLNGNLRYDNNKKITSIEYNHLNLPWKITVKNDDGTSKGTIIYIYDASGNKLEKRTNELASSYNSNTAKQTATAYTGGFVYENNKLQFFGHEEGRVRFKQFIDGSNQPQTTYIFDYFLKDHLGNTRMVLTEEQQTDIYQAGMETTNRNFEVALFGNKINTTAQTPKPSGFDVDGANQVVSKLNGTSAENRVGPGVLLKVMAGDKFNAKTQAWYLPTAMDNTTDNSLQNIVANLLGQLTPSVIAAGKGTTAINATNTILQPGVENLLNSQAPASGAPKAYLNWILLDEKTFTSVANGFVSIPVITGTMQKQLLQVNSGNDVSITKNSYLYVYVSNESKGNVYFDDIRIEHKRGAMLEETHYYPFGLTMSGISSKAAGGLENKKGYNGNEIQNKEFSDGSGLELYDFNARTYDQQTGRFIQVDPLDDEGEQESLSPYHFGENNPIRYNDPDGRCPNCITGAIGAGLGALIGGGIEIVSQLYNNGSVNNWTSVGGAALQGGITGGAAGLTGGASLLTTTAVAGAANAVGGTANRAIQGQSTTAKDVIVDATIGAGLGAAGKVVGNVVKGAVNNLSNAAKGKLGEAVTQIKYGAQGYKSTGKAVVETGGKTATGRVQVAKYDHAMKNVITGKQLTVESKFNGSTLTRNQTAAQSNITTTRGLIISRTTSQQLGNGAKAATVAAGAGAAAQKNINN